MYYQVTAVHKKPDNDVTILTFTYNSAEAALRRYEAEMYEPEHVKVFLTDPKGVKVYQFKRKNLRSIV